MHLCISSKVYFAFSYLRMRVGGFAMLVLRCCNTVSPSLVKAAFNCIRSLWNRKPLKVYGGRMAESMLAILCHILRGEPVIQERLAKEREGTVRPDDEAASTVSLAPSGAPGASTTTAGEAPAAGTGTGTTPAVPAGGGGGGGGGGSADDSTNSTPRREPQVNQAQLTQVCGEAV